MSLYNKYRPKSLDQLVGQPTAVAQLQGLSPLPHAFLFSGPSGSGKTTAARIIAGAATNGPGMLNVTEMNCAANNGVDVIRGIEDKIHMRPLGGGDRWYILDESHQLTSQAQRAMLKLLEDPPKYVHFILCTTNPEKLEKPVLTRCVNITFYNIPKDSLIALLRSVAEQEGITQHPDLGVIADSADGSARKALVLLEQIAATKDGSDWFKILEKPDEATEVFELVRAIYSGRFKFGQWTKVLKDLPESDIEGLRLRILAYGSAILLGNSKNLEEAQRIMSLFVEPFFYSKKPGFVLAVSKV